MEHETRESEELIARVAFLLRRLLHGEEAHPELFDELKRGTEFLASNDINSEQLKTFESVLVLRILHNMGYVGNDLSIRECLDMKEITKELLDKCGAIRTQVNQIINKGLKESHL